MIPSMGRIVIYRLTADDAEKINRRRTTGASIAKRIAIETWPVGAQAHIGNYVRPGEAFPLITVRSSVDGEAINGQVMLDGNDTYWVVGAKEEDNSRESSGEIEGTWCWPERH